MADTHHSSQKCTSATCCSPSRLWRSVQAMITNNAKDIFDQACADPNRSAHLGRVLLTHRAANDPLLYPASHKHRVLQFDSSVRTDACRTFGRAVTDLNALQLALIQRRQDMAELILRFLQTTVSSKELGGFVNHTWGQRNTSLHLACFLNMPQVVRLLLECGADPTMRNARQLSPDHGGVMECVALLSSPDPSPDHGSVVSGRGVVSGGNKTSDNSLVSDNTRHRVSTGVSTIPPVSPLARPLPLRSRPRSQPTLSLVDTTPLILQRHRNKEASFLLRKAAKGTEEKQEQEEQGPRPLMPIPQDYFESVHIDLKRRTDREMDSPTEVHLNRASVSPLSFSSSTSSLDSFSSLEENEMEAKTSTFWSPPISPATDSWDEEEQEESTVSHLLPSQGSSDSTLLGSSEKEMETKPPPARQVHFMPQVILMDACVRGDLPEVKEIVKQIMDTSTSFPMQHSTDDVHNRSLLHHALMHGHEDIVCYLTLEAKVNMNHADNDGWTALHYAAALGLWNSLEYLSTLPGIDLLAKTHHGLLVQDCPESPMDRRRCQWMMEKAIKRTALVRPTRVRAATAIRAATAATPSPRFTSRSLSPRSTSRSTKKTLC